MKLAKDMGHKYCILNREAGVVAHNDVNKKTPETDMFYCRRD